MSDSIKRMKFGKNEKYTGEIDLIQKAMLTKEARTDLYEHSYDLALTIAEKYDSSIQNQKKLARTAMKNFDKAFMYYIKNSFTQGKKYRFTTYFTWWIRKAIEDELGINEVKEGETF